MGYPLEIKGFFSSEFSTPRILRRNLLPTISLKCDTARPHLTLQIAEISGWLCPDLELVRLIHRVIELSPSRRVVNLSMHHMVKAKVAKPAAQIHRVGKRQPQLQQSTEGLQHIYTVKGTFLSSK